MLITFPDDPPNGLKYVYENLVNKINMTVNSYKQHNRSNNENNFSDKIFS